MRSLTFKKDFDNAIFSGSKTTTIRKFRALKPLKVGEKVLGYIDEVPRYKLEIVKLESIEITDYEGSYYIGYGDPMKSPSSFEIDQYAKADGFKSAGDMIKHYKNKNSLPFRGQIIHFRKL